MHTRNCKCAACLSDRDRAYEAARQLVELLDLDWLGFRHAIEVARSIRSGNIDWLPERTQLRCAVLRGTPTFESLLSDILD